MGVAAAASPVPGRVSAGLSLCRGGMTALSKLSAGGGGVNRACRLQLMAKRASPSS